MKRGEKKYKKESISKMATNSKRIVNQLLVFTLAPLDLLPFAQTSTMGAATPSPRLAPMMPRTSTKRSMRVNSTLINDCQPCCLLREKKKKNEPDEPCKTFQSVEVSAVYKLGLDMAIKRSSEGLSDRRCRC